MGMAVRVFSQETMSSEVTCEVAAACVEGEVFAQAAPVHRRFFAEQEFRLLRKPVDWAAVSAVDGGVYALAEATGKSIGRQRDGRRGNSGARLGVLVGRKPGGQGQCSALSR